MGAMLASWLEAYGLLFVFAATFVSCLGAPIPALVVMLAAGAAAATQGAALWPVFLAALAGALPAGMVVFWAGRRYGQRAVDRVRPLPGWGPLIARAEATHDTWGSAAVFIGASLVAQLGPAVNVVAGAANLSWWRFHAGHLPGRVIWVGGYSGLGYGFADNIDVIAGQAANVSWIVAGLIAGLAAFVAFWRLRR